MAEEAAEGTIGRYLDELTARLASQGLNARWQLLRSATLSDRIAEVAQEYPDNMIVLASHGRSGLVRWVMGSVAEELIRATGNPVLVIPSRLTEEHS